eukprot:GEMP01038579.1.p1 GENE.GEMP01038579.1~~GEMP01038579.1.p1  ORF type:complete len:322 (+),score=76.74 GEMP01038579.1:92-1057(+)
MNKYRRVPQEKEKKESPENEIRVAATGRTATYVSYASKMFIDKSLKSVRVIATGNALGTAVTICEILKRRFKGLHQITKIGSFEIVDEYEPLEEGLDNVTDVRNVSFIELLLSLDPLDEKDKGYQSPLPEDQVKEVTAEEMIRGGRRKRAGSGSSKGARSPKGKGKGGKAAKGGGGKQGGGTKKGGGKGAAKAGGGKGVAKAGASKKQKGGGRGGPQAAKDSWDSNNWSGWVDYGKSKSGWVDYGGNKSGWVDYGGNRSGWIDYGRSDAWGSQSYGNRGYDDNNNWGYSGYDTNRSKGNRARQAVNQSGGGKKGGHRQGRK